MMNDEKMEVIFDSRDELQFHLRLMRGLMESKPSLRLCADDDDGSFFGYSRTPQNEARLPLLRAPLPMRGFGVKKKTGRTRAINKHEERLGGLDRRTRRAAISSDGGWPVCLPA